LKCSFEMVDINDALKCLKCFEMVDINDAALKCSFEMKCFEMKCFEMKCFEMKCFEMVDINDALKCSFEMKWWILMMDFL
ncbi:hypothetical protein L9F63_009378, partial [Diploptera punctata]